MSKYGLLIDYKYCTGCHSCEVACKNEKELAHGEWGIKLMEVGPWKLSTGQWEWEYLPVPTTHCDLCADRVKDGKLPTCAFHCLAGVIEYGTTEDLAKRMDELGNKVTMYVP